MNEDTLGNRVEFPHNPHLLWVKYTPDASLMINLHELISRDVISTMH